MQVRDEYIPIKKIGSFLNIYVMPDCHIGSPAFLEDEYERLTKIIEKDPFAKVIFQGDILDSNRPSTRAIKKVAYHDRQEEYEQEDKRNEFWIEQTVVPKLKRIITSSDKCLGMMDGDHFMTMSNGLSSTQLLSRKFKVPYLGDGQALIKFHFNYKVNKHDLTMHVQHGIAGGGRSGTGVNKLEDTANIWDNVDIFVRGHSHKGFIVPISKYYSPEGTKEIKQRDIWLVNTPSFRTGFLIGQTDYTEQKNYAATAHKFPVIQLSYIDNKLNIQGSLL